MTWVQFTSWLKATLPALGGAGLFLAAFLDSSFIPLPLVTDFMVMDFSSRHPLRTLYYVAAAAFGSLVGAIWIYLLARKGGQAYYEKRQGRPAGRIHAWAKRYPLASVFLPAMAPFPVPFKPFVAAQGALQIPLATFAVGTFVSRGCRFLFEGLLGARYGSAAREYVMQRKWTYAAIFLAVVIVFLAITRFSNYRKNRRAQAN